MIETFDNIGSNAEKADELFSSVLDQCSRFLVHINTVSGSSMGITDHDNLLFAQPYILKAERSADDISSFLIAVDDIDTLVRIGLLPGWESVTFNILLGFGVYHEFDNDRNTLLDLAHTINYSAITDRINLWFIQGWDLYSNTDMTGNISRAAYYKNTLSVLSGKQLSFFLCNQHVVDEIKLAIPEATSKYYAIYPARMTASPIAESHPKFFNSCTRLDDRHRTRKIICLNNAEKTHRTHIVNIIQQYDSNDYYLTLRAKNILLDKDRKCPSTDIISSNLQDHPPIRYITDAYVYIATETYACGYDHSFNAGASAIQGTGKLNSWWSEKTFKAIYYELPFMVVGLPRTIEYLKVLGFETFPELFDESYDNIARFSDKEYIYEQNINKIMSMSYDDLHDFYYSNSTQAKLRHNKETFYKLLSQSEFTGVCDDPHVAYRRIQPAQ